MARLPCGGGEAMTEGVPPHHGPQESLTTADLGEDIIAAEILPRLPVKSLLRFKTVCRSWRTLISGPSFVAEHLNRSKNSPKLAIAHLKEDANNLFQILPGCNHATRLFWMELGGEARERFPSLQHSNGMLLLGAGRELVLCNPSTREHKFLPQCSSLCEKATIGFVPGDNVYKVVHINPYFHRQRCEVLTLGIDSSWRAPAEYPPYRIDLRCGPVSASGGMVYFKIDDYNFYHSSAPKEYILYFNLKTEKFAVIPPPPAKVVKMCGSDYWLQELDGTLCFIDRFPGADGHGVWMYKGDCATTHPWDHAFTVGLSDLACSFHIIGSMSGGKVLLCTEGSFKRKWLEYYDPVSKALTHAADLEEISVVSGEGANNHPLRHCVDLQVFSYVESLLPVPWKMPVLVVRP